MSGQPELCGCFWVPSKRVCISLPLGSHGYYEGSGTTPEQRLNMQRGDKITLLMNKSEGSQLTRVQCEATYLCRGS